MCKFAAAAMIVIVFIAGGVDSEMLFKPYEFVNCDLDNSTGAAYNKSYILSN